MNSGATVLTKFTADTKDFDRGIKKVNVSTGSIAKGVLVATGVTKALSKAWSMVTGSVDSAIDRLDTMRNFPNVMKNFGVNTDEANASIKRIDKSVRGLPTSLDQAVAGVQDIFMVTKDLSKAEKMFQAINDSAMVFAKGSTEAVDRFIYGYKQAMSAGKVSAQDFNQMNEAIPGLMDKVAEAMGLTYGELKEGLSKGTISMEQFNTALKQLDTEGVGSMKAMKDAAKDSTGGIRTAMTNMQTAVTRGVAGVIEQIDKALKDAGFGGLAGAAASVGKAFESVLKGIGSAMAVVLPKIISFGQWIIKNKDWILAILVPIVTFVGVLKVLSTVIRAVAIAQAILNAVMAINPVVLIIAGIIALIAAFIYLWNKCEWFRNFWIGLWNGIVGLVQVAIAIIKIVINTIVGIIKTAWANIQAVFNFIKPVIDMVVGVFKGLWENIKIIFAVIVAIIQTCINRWIATFKVVYSYVSGFIKGIVNFFKGLGTSIGNAVGNIVNFIKSIPGKIMSVPGKIFNFFKSLPGKMLNIGLDIVKGIGRGITNGVKWIKNVITGFVGNVMNFIKKLFKIGSPSKLMANEIGQWLPKGIGVGITANTDAVSQAMNGVEKEMLNAFQLSPQITNSAGLHYSPNVVVNNEVNFKQDPLGQMVRDVKTFSGGAKNDFNYGTGVS